ncbi:ATP-dependent rRNA helicase RRP3, partial [Clarias magur]
GETRSVSTPCPGHVGGLRDAGRALPETPRERDVRRSVQQGNGRTAGTQRRRHRPRPSAVVRVSPVR